MASRDEIIRFVFEVTGNEDIAAAVKVMLQAGDAGDAANDQIRGLVDELNKLGDTSKAIQSFVSTKAALAEVTEQLALAEDGLVGLIKEFSKADDSSRAVSKAYSAAEKSVADLTAQQRALQVEFAKAQGTLQKAGVDTDHLAAANDDLKRKASGVADTLAATAKQASGAGKGLKDAGDGAKHLGDEAKSSGGILSELRDNLGKIVTVAGAVSLALKGIEFGKERFAEAADLEESLTRIRALAGDAQASLAGYETGIRDAAGQAGVSANMAAAAMAGLVQQGRSADEALQALVPTLLLAKTAQIDVAQAAGIVDAALSQFGGSAADAANFVDILVAAAKGSKDGIAGLTDGVTKLAPLARDLNLTFQDTVGILGFMTRNGLSAGDATKGLGAIFRDLKDPASTLRQELFALGGGTSDFDKAINTLATSGERGKDALLRLDDSTRKVVLFLQQQGVQGLDKFKASLGNVQGAASALDKQLGDNLKGALGDFGRAFDEIGARLAQPVLEPLKVELKSLADRLNAFAQSPAFAELQTKIGELARNGIEAIDTFISGVDWSAFIAGAKSAISEASATIASFKDDLSGVAAAVSKVADVIGLVYRSIAVVFDTARIAIGSLSEEGAAKLLTLTQSIDGLTGSTSEATKQLEAIRDASRDAVNSGLTDLERNTGKLTENLKSLAGLGGEAGDAIGEIGDSAQRSSSELAQVGDAVSVTREELERLGQVGPPTLHEMQLAALDAAGASDDHARALRDAQGAVESTRAELERLTQSGQSNAAAFQAAQNAYETARQRLAALQGQAQSAAEEAGKLAEAFQKLGITSQAELTKGVNGAEAYAAALDTVWKAYQDGKASIEDVRAAFEAYAAKQLEVVKNSDAWKQQQVKDALEVKKSLLGLSDIPSPKLPDFKQPRQDVQGLGADASKAGDAVEGVGEKGKQAAKEVSDGFAQLAGIYQKWTAQFEQTSQAAALRFQELTKHINDFEISLNVYAQADVVGLVKLGEAISEAARRTQAEVDEQKRRVADLSAQYQGMTAAAIQAMAAQQGGAEGLARSLEAQAAAARNGQTQLELLGASDLSPLASALDGVAAKARQLAQQAQSARESFADLASSLEEQIAQQQGDLTKAENVRFQNQIEQLRKQAQESNTLGSAEYAEAVQRATQLHTLKLKQLQEQAAAQKKNDDEAAAREKEAARKRELDAAQTDAGADTGKTQPGQNLGTFTVNIGTQSFAIQGTATTAAQVRAMLAELARQAKLQPEKR